MFLNTTQHISPLFIHHLFVSMTFCQLIIQNVTTSITKRTVCFQMCYRITKHHQSNTSVTSHFSDLTFSRETLWCEKLFRLQMHYCHLPCRSGNYKYNRLVLMLQEEWKSDLLCVWARHLSTSVKSRVRIQDKQLNNGSWVWCFIYSNRRAILLIVSKCSSPTAVWSGKGRQMGSSVLLSTKDNMV